MLEHSFSFEHEPYWWISPCCSDLTHTFCPLEFYWNILFDTSASRMVVVTTIDCGLALPLLLSRGGFLQAAMYHFPRSWWQMATLMVPFDDTKPQELPHIAVGERSRIRQISWQNLAKKRLLQQLFMVIPVFVRQR